MAKYPGLFRRGNIYQVRKRIPEDVRQLIADKPAIWRNAVMNPGSPLAAWKGIVTGRGKARSVRRETTLSLRTSGLREAKAKYHTAMAELETAFGLMRSALADHARAPTDQDLRMLAYRFYAREDGRADTNLSSLSYDDQDREQMRDNLRDDFAAHGFDDPAFAAHFLSTASEMLHATGFRDDDYDRSLLAGYLRRADKLLLMRNLARVDGTYDSLPTDDALFPSAMRNLGEAAISGPTLREAYEHYKAERTEHHQHYKTTQKYEHQWLLMSDAFGAETPVAAISRADAKQFYEMLKSLPPHWQTKADYAGLTPKQAAAKAISKSAERPARNTVDSKMNYFSSFLNWAVQEQIVPNNVAKGLLPRRKKGAAQSTRKSFTVDDLKKLFGPNYPTLAKYNGSLNKPVDIKTALPTDARYWAPLIALYTGMRLSEICQLTKAEFQSTDGIDCILAAWSLSTSADDDEDIDDDEVTRSQKTDAAPRKIPIVDELKKLGLLELVQSIDGGDRQRIFPDLTPDKRGYVSPPVSRWFSRYKEKVGIVDDGKVFHSFRHTFRDALSDAEVSHEVMVQIGGWSSKDQSDGYGSGGRLKRAYKELSCVKYEGLDLSHLHIVGPTEP